MVASHDELTKIGVIFVRLYCKYFILSNIFDYTKLCANLVLTTFVGNLKIRLYADLSGAYKVCLSVD